VTPIRLKVVHAGSVASQFQIVGQSDLETTVMPDALNTFPTRTTASPGDTLGIYLSGFAGCGRSGQASDYIGYHNNLDGDTQPPNTETFTGPFPAVEYDIAATLERDCDSDGFGDETQDTNLSSCAPAPGPGPGPTPGPAPTPSGQAPVTCNGLAATIVGTEGNDVRTGSQGPDVIVGLGGNDTLTSLRGNDVICGGPGRDTLKGGKGKDTLLGQKGKDALKGGGGNDLCKGGKGADSASKCEVEKSI
jgi:Ca2+-binding RTX toxin-like protein